MYLPLHIPKNKDMHGIVFNGLQKFVTASYNYSTWIDLCKEANVHGKMYFPTDTYPDEEVLAIVVAASKATGNGIPIILENFGEFMINDLMKIYRHSLNPDWNTSLDLLANVEETIHKAVRMKNPNATPPQLECKRTSFNEVIIRYRSKRKLCFLARGLITGVSKYFNEELIVTEPTCMNSGDEECKLIINLK